MYVSRSDLKIVLIDCNAVFRSMMMVFAESRGIDLSSYESVVEMGSVGCFGDYDIAIIESETGDLSGLEIGQYLSSLMEEMPVILISNGLSPDGRARLLWPGAIKDYIHKDLGADAILDRALAAG